MILEKLSNDKTPCFLLILPEPVGHKGHFKLQMFAGSITMHSGNPGTQGLRSNLDKKFNPALKNLLGV